MSRRPLLPNSWPKPKRKPKAPPKYSSIPEKSFSGKLEAAKKLRSKKPIRARNPKRQASEFARCFHSRDRVRFVKSLPCLYCSSLSPFIASVTGPSDNAHTVKEGMGRRGPYTSIVPLCRNHHRWYDERRGPFAQPELREAIAAAAVRTEGLWLLFVGRRDEVRSRVPQKERRER